MEGKFDDALIGRAILASAVFYLKDSMRHYGLECTRTEVSHIELWKRSMHDDLEDPKEALQEMADCPLCSSIIAAWQARKILKGKLGRISGGLTRAGAALRRKRFPPPEPEVPTIVSVICDNDCPF